jgi:hypothetical protein
MMDPDDTRMEYPAQGAQGSDDLARMRDREDREDRDEPDGGLFSQDRSEDYRRRWDEIQARFVDDPREAVQRADELVSEVTRSLVSSFQDERGRLEDQWASGGDASTEDLRVALQRYRSFFQRLLST